MEVIMFSPISLSKYIIKFSSNHDDDAINMDLMIKPFDIPGNFSFDQDNEKFRVEDGFSINLVMKKIKKR